MSTLRPLRPVRPPVYEDREVPSSSARRARPSSLTSVTSHSSSTSTNSHRPAHRAAAAAATSVATEKPPPHPSVLTALAVAVLSAAHGLIRATLSRLSATRKALPSSLSASSLQQQQQHQHHQHQHHQHPAPAAPARRCRYPPVVYVLVFACVLLVALLASSDEPASASDADIADEQARAAARVAERYKHVNSALARSVRKTAHKYSGRRWRDADAERRGGRAAPVRAADAAHGSRGRGGARVAGEGEGADDDGNDGAGGGLTEDTLVRLRELSQARKRGSGSSGGNVQRHRSGKWGWQQRETGDEDDDESALQAHERTAKYVAGRLQNIEKLDNTGESGGDGGDSGGDGAGDSGKGMRQEDEDGDR